MYKAMAAYAAGLIANKDRFISVFPFGVESGPIWGITADGDQCYVYLAQAHKLSVLGAMRAAQEVFTNDVRAYNSVYEKMMTIARNEYDIYSIADLTHDIAVKVLIAIAKGQG